MTQVRRDRDEGMASLSGRSEDVRQRLLERRRIARDPACVGIPRPGEGHRPRVGNRLESKRLQHVLLVGAVPGQIVGIDERCLISPSAKAPDERRLGYARLAPKNPDSRVRRYRWIQAGEQAVERMWRRFERNDDNVTWAELFSGQYRQP